MISQSFLLPGFLLLLCLLCKLIQEVLPHNTAPVHKLQRRMYLANHTQVQCHLIPVCIYFPEAAHGWQGCEWILCTSGLMLLRCAQIVWRHHCSNLSLQWLITGWRIPTSTCPASKHDVLRGIAAGVERAQFWTLNIFACNRHICTHTHTHTCPSFSLQTCRFVTRMLMIPWRSSRRTVFAESVPIFAEVAGHTVEIETPDGTGGH